MQLIISRSQWIRGEYWSGSKLFRSSDNKKCCLGFYLTSCCGFSNEEVKDINSPNFLLIQGRTKLFESHGKWLLPHLKAQSCSADGSQLILLNDDTRWYQLEDGELKREEKIKEVFAKNDVEVVFID